MIREPSSASDIDPDLPALPVEDLAETVERRAHPGVHWSRIAAWILAVIAVSALLTMCWQLHEQTKIARHEACITDAQQATSFTQAQGVIAKAIARCFSNPQSLLSGTQVVVPGVVSVHLAEAERDLTQIGLQGRLVHGPAGRNAYIIGQEPPTGASVPAGTTVDITTRAP